MVTTADTVGQLQSDAGGDFNQHGVWTIVVAGGSGNRFGSLKQFERLGEHRMIDVSVEVAQANSDGVVLVLPQEGFDTHYETFITGAPHQQELTVVPGGATRAESVVRGLEAVPMHAGIILVHDAARPLATTDIYDRVIAAVAAGAVAVVPAVEVADSLRHVDEGAIDRAGMWAVQTPQGFHAVALRRSHEATLDYEGITDDAMLVEASGHTVTMVAGDPTNIKVTHPKDLVMATLIYQLGTETETA